MPYLEYINDMMLRIPKSGCIIMLGFGISGKASVNFPNLCSHANKFLESQRKPMFIFHMQPFMPVNPWNHTKTQAQTSIFWGITHLRSIILEIPIKKLPHNTAVSLRFLFFSIIDCSDVVSVLSAFEADFLNVCISFCFSFFVCCACCCYTENSAA